jgi:hypothetical protein
MKHIRILSGKVQLEILEDYKAKLPNGHYRYLLSEIAAKHEISLSTINNLARKARCAGRPHGGQKLIGPPPHVLKILRDFTEPDMTYKKCGERNPRIINGVEVPRSKQRIKQIVDYWRERHFKVKRRGFQPGDIIKWDGQEFEVIRYDNRRRGAVRRIIDGEIVDPFRWRDGNRRSVRLEGQNP